MFVVEEIERLETELKNANELMDASNKRGEPLMATSSQYYRQCLHSIIVLLRCRVFLHIDAIDSRCGPPQ